MRDIKELARQVKMPYDFLTGEPLYLAKLEAFAELVRADALAARTAVPDALTIADRESADYRDGFNDCRAVMLEMTKNRSN